MRQRRAINVTLQHQNTKASFSPSAPALRRSRASETDPRRVIPEHMTAARTPAPKRRGLAQPAAHEPARIGRTRRTDLALDECAQVRIVDFAETRAQPA